MATVSWNDIIKKAQKEINAALKEEVFEEIRDVYQKHIDQDVYDVYSPSIYIRRDISGGLIADENIIGEIANGVLEVKDIAPLNTSMGNKNYDNLSQTYLAEIIEYGKAYTGSAKYLFEGDMSGEPWANPRPFTENTIEDLKQNKQHIEALKKGLKKRGIKID